MKYLNLKALVLVLPIALLAACSKSGSDSNQGTKPKDQGTPLAITSISASSGPFNTSVVISGTGFDAAQSSDQVFFNGKAATITAATKSQITATVPVGAGTGPVSVIVNNSTPVTGPVFTYQLSYAASVLAGSSQAGEVNGTGAAAAFRSLRFITVDAAGNLYVTDSSDPVVRKITPGGVVTSYAGLSKIAGNNGTVTSQQLNLPSGVAIDKDGNLLVGDEYTGGIRKITPQGATSFLEDNGKIAYFTLPEGLAVAKDGTMYVVDTELNILYKITAQGQGTWIAGSGQQGFANGKGKAASFNSPIGVAADANGNVFVCDDTNPHIRKVAPDYTVTDFTNAAFAGAISMAFDSKGTLFVADHTTGVISRVSAAGIATPFAGNGSLNGVANGLTFSALTAITIDANDNIYVADGNQVTKIAYQ